MARPVDRARRLSAPARRPPLVRDFSAGGLVHRRRRDRCEVVLVGRGRDAPERIVWTIPKGHLETGESPEDAAVREVREETGIEAVVEGLLGDVTYHFGRQDARGERERVLKRVRFFLMRACGGRFADRDAEMDYVRWFPLPEAERSLTYENERALVRRARELLES
jgi:ADP-ribose pyrophosphatase YjhB (NUDIX family)